MKTITDLGNGNFGYKIEVGGMNIIQKYKPAIAGNIPMSFDEAGLLAEFIEAKMLASLSPAVTPEQVEALMLNKNIVSLIDAELSLIAEAANNPILLPDMR